MLRKYDTGYAEMINTDCQNRWQKGRKENYFQNDM